MRKLGLERLQITEQVVIQRVTQGKDVSAF